MKLLEAGRKIGERIVRLTLCKKYKFYFTRMKAKQIRAGKPLSPVIPTVAITIAMASKAMSVAMATIAIKAISTVVAIVAVITTTISAVMEVAIGTPAAAIVQNLVM